MSRIDDLIAAHCPGGVTYRVLGEVITLDFGDRITKLKDMGTLYPVYGGGGESFRTDAFNREDDFVVSRFAMSARCVRKVSGKFWLLDSGFTYTPKTVEIDKAFISYVLLNMQSDIYACSSQGAQKNLRVDTFKKFRVPVPPLEVQREIVRVLDLFQSLEAELEAELEARRRQYAHYRDSLVQFTGESIERLTLGEAGELFRGRRFTKEDYVDEGLPAIHYGELYTRYGSSAVSVVTNVRAEMAPNLRFVKPGDIVIAEVGETVEDVGKATAWLGDREVAIHDGCYGYRHSMNPMFLAYYFQSAQFHADKAKHVARAKLKRLSLSGLKQIEIPVPSMTEQDRIVEVLSGFESLIEDVSIGLPAELAARRLQYEHYRDRLLMFEHAA